MSGFAFGAWVITAIAAVGLRIDLAIAVAFLVIGSGLLVARVRYDNRWLGTGKGIGVLGIILLVVAVYPPPFDLVFTGPALTGVAGIIVLLSWVWGGRFAYNQESTE